MAEFFDKIFKELFDNLFGQSQSGSNVPATEESVLLVELSSVARVAIFQKGKAHPVEIAFNSYAAPLWIAIMGYTVYFGGLAIHAKRMSQAGEKHTYYYDLAESFESKNDSPPGPFVFVHQEEKAGYKRCEPVSLEFMLGLFIRHLKKVAVHKQGLNEQSLKTILITVPMWFSSVLRQTCKDAGTIAGFEKVILINKMTALPFFFLSGRFEDEPIGSSAWTCSKRSLLVISESSNNVDAVTYDYWQDPMGRKILKMTGCFGNYYETDKTEDGVNRKLQNFYFKQRPEKLALRKAMMEVLLMEAYRKLNDCGHSTKDVKVITSCDLRSWTQIINNVMMKRFGTSVVLKTSTNSIVYAGRGALRQDPGALLVQALELPDQITELNPLTFYRRDKENAYIPDVILKRDDNLPGATTVCSLEIKIPRSTDVIVYQKNGLDLELRIGKLYMRRLLYYMYAEIGTTFIIERDGILKFSHVFGISNKGEVELVSDEHFKWNGVNQSENEIERYRLLVNHIFLRYSTS